MQQTAFLMGGRVLKIVLPPFWISPKWLGTDVLNTVIFFNKLQIA